MCLTPPFELAGVSSWVNFWKKQKKKQNVLNMYYDTALCLKNQYSGKLFLLSGLLWYIRSCWNAFLNPGLPVAALLLLLPPVAVLVLVLVGVLVRVSESLLELVCVLVLVAALVMVGRLVLLMPGGWWDVRLQAPTIVSILLVVMVVLGAPYSPIWE